MENIICIFIFPTGGIQFRMNNSDFNSKRIVRMFIMSVCNIKPSDIARELHLSDSFVRKHLEGVRYCMLVDKYLTALFFGFLDEGGNNG